MKQNTTQKIDIRQSADSDVLELYIYTDVAKGGADGEARKSEASAGAIREKLEAAEGISAINIYINSLGGSVMEGVAIYNQLKRHKAYKTVYIDGFACSVASVIAMAGDRVVMPCNTMMMIHNASMAAFGNAAELRKSADDLDCINEASRQAYLLKAGGKLSEEQLREMMDKETWLTAAQCVELGLADDIAGQIDLARAEEMLHSVKQRATAGLEQAAQEGAAVESKRESHTEKVNLLSALIRAFGKEE